MNMDIQDNLESISLCTVCNPVFSVSSLHCFGVQFLQHKQGGFPINTLVTGGARSGKSSYAQKRAEDSGEKVLFVATAQAFDEEMRQRIEAHKRSRLSSWTTLETPTGVGKAILETISDEKVVLLDCITLLVNNVFNGFGENMDAAKIEEAAVREIQELIDCMKSLDVDFLIVTNEVGLGLVPDNEAGRFYRDILGRVNSLLAAFCDEVYLIVAGIPVKIKPER
ncbi:MAG: bifunctional adenosylcobinamide kinase/adenosylcobinamide-phosphate guanylyltransferase [Dehalococcoidales bacterium]|nr:bifunctional adenosylcobinamide kinase/adenosylcobinamide-phosphate guanylyltransferase [Dehalococcoidales bacterium]